MKRDKITVSASGTLRKTTLRGIIPMLLTATRAWAQTNYVYMSRGCYVTRYFDMIKKFVFLGALMLMTAESILAQSSWDGITMHTTLNDAGITESGTEADPYIIDNANKFVAFGALANNSTAYWKLTVDIDLGGYEWPYSGNNAKTFKGHFDGGGHTVSNYAITPVTNKANGLFGTVQGSNSTTGRAEIKNLKLDDVTISTTSDLSSTTNIGALVGNSNQYVDFKNIQIVDGNGNGNTVNITFNNLIGNCNIGGLIGQLNKDSRMEDCTVNNPVILIQGEGAVKGTVYIGGAIGLMQGASATEVSKIDKPTSGSTNGLTVNDPSVTVHKITTTWYISTAIGRINNYSDVNYVTIKDPTLVYKAVGSPNVDLYLGTLTSNLAGNVGSASATPVATSAKNINITGTSNITIGVDTEVREIKKVKAGVVGYALNNVDIDTWNVGTSNIIADGSLTTSNNYFGGVIGHAQSNSSAASTDTQTQIKNVTLGSSTITVTGNVVKESHIGHFFGRIEGYINSNSTTAIPKRTIVSNLTATGTTKIVFGSDSKKVDVANVRAGAIGSAAVNSDISTCTLADTEIEVNGNLITGSSYIGGIMGQVQSSTSAFPGVEEGAVATKVHSITVKKSDVNVTGNVSVQSFVGGGFGQVTGATSTTVAWQPTEITDIDIKNTSNTGISSVTIGTNNTNTINYVRAGGVIGMAGTNVILDDWDIENIDIEINGKLLTTSSNIGGCVGTLQSASNAPAKATNIQITKSDVVAINGDVEKEAYFGGVFGRMDGSNNTQNQPATAENVTVAGLDMTFGGDLKQNVYAGGIVGYLMAMNTTSCPTTTSVTNCSASGQIHSSGTPTLKEGLYYAFGGIVGYNNQSSTTNQSKIRQCVSEVDINLSGYTPATATNLTKLFFIVGGVIGRLDNPSLLPEHLYYSGKIYAPYATVGPIVGTFYKNAGAQYVYEDYSGEYASPTLSAQEWKKANTWYYNDYKLGLSADVRTQTARTRNYSDPTTNIGGVEYLTVTDKTFSAANSLNGAKVSRTVLRYTANNKDVDFGIYPQWTTSSSSYPTYYMYYMQGVNRGVYMENEEFAKELISKEVSVLPSISTDQSGDDYTFTVSLGEIEDDSDFSLAYQWYQQDGTTEIAGETSKSITLAESVIDSYGGAIYCKITVSGTNFSPDVIYTLIGRSAIVVFIDGTNGVDNTHGSTARGWTPDTPVKTIDHANSLLKSEAEGGSWDKNIIVVMGLLDSDYKFQSSGHNPATLTGKWDGIDYGGVIRLDQIDQTGGEHVLNHATWPGQKGANCYVLGPTKFEYLVFEGKNRGNNFIELHGNDAFFGKGLVMREFNNLSPFHGNLTDETIPEFTIILTATNISKSDVDAYSGRTSPGRTKPQEVTFQSGHYGRIIAGRFTAGFFNVADNTSHSILGSPAHPYWAVVNIDIDEDNEPTDGGSTTYTCDINAIIAGLTDGTMYGDYTINVHGGKIAYIVGGNQGNTVINGTATYTPVGGVSGKWGQWPNASYCGRTVINVEQDDDCKDIIIGDVYAGGLGRQADSTSAPTVVEMFMYGHTEVNMLSGTVTGNVYGGGTGGVIGHNPWDTHTPYATTAPDAAGSAIQDGAQYGDLRAGSWSSMTAESPMASVTLHNLNDEGEYETEQLDLSKSSTALNISGGTIDGSVYGGGYGYVNNMPALVTMQGVGSVFGNSTVHISGGSIGGNIYGGSQGHSGYYGQNNKYGQTITHIAEMNGNVDMRITGTDEHYPTIGGNIYGAGQGVASKSATEEYPRIATTGNNDLGEQYKTDINITIDLPEGHPFTGNIYGGGEMGAVDGTTNVVINGGVLGQVVDGQVVNGNVFGGGKGEPGHPDKAKVTGTTHVNINTESTDEVMGDVYGGGELAQVVGNTQVDITSGPVRGDVYGGGSLADIVGYTAVNLNGGKIHSAYGGGLGSKVGVNGATANVEAHVTGNTAVVLDGSVVLGEIFGCNNLNGTPQGHVLVDIKTTAPKGTETQEHPYHVAAVYGGGNLAAYVPTNANDYAEVLVENCDNSIEDVFGGGNAATVPNTEVTIWGGLINRVFAGGNGASSPADVTNNTHLILHGGTINEVYGGSNSQGTIGGTIIVDVEAEAFGENDLCPIAVTDLYGGGNMAASNAGRITIGCTGEGTIANVYGGANNADVTGDINLNITGGKIGNVFGGNNNSGSISGTITVNVDWEGSCPSNHLENVYGGGRDAAYTAPEDNKDYPRVFVRNASIEHDVYGGGLGETAQVTGNPQVTVSTDCTADGHTNEVHSVHIKGSVYGGGSAAPVTGNPVVNTRGLAGDTKKVQIDNHVFGGGLGQTAVVTGNTKVNIKGNTVVSKNVYGGGNGGEVTGDTNIVIGD